MRELGLLRRAEPGDRASDWEVRSGRLGAPAAERVPGADRRASADRFEPGTQSTRSSRTFHRPARMPPVRGLWRSRVPRCSGRTSAWRCRPARRRPTRPRAVSPRHSPARREPSAAHAAARSASPGQARPRLPRRRARPASRSACPCPRRGRALASLAHARAPSARRPTRSPGGARHRRLLLRRTTSPEVAARPVPHGDRTGWQASSCGRPSCSPPPIETRGTAWWSRP